MLATTKLPATPSRFQGFNAWLRRKWISTRRLSKLSLLLTIIVCIVCWPRIFITIDPGHGGVMWKRFHNGTELCKTYGEGLHVIGPWNRMYIYDTRTLQMPFSTVLYTQDGLNISVSGSLRYRLNIPLLSYLQTALGPDYEERLLRPQVISALRKTLGDFNPHQIYSEDEKGVLQKLRSTLEADMRDVLDVHYVAPACQQFAAAGYLFIEEFLLLNVTLPVRVESAVQYKLEQEQYAEAYEYILKRERDERTRRGIEAQGIREFEATSGISILKWRGIEATEKLATSSNAKVIIAGTGANQLPVILNAESPPAAAKLDEAVLGAQGDRQPKQDQKPSHVPPRPALRPRDPAPAGTVSDRGHQP